MVPVEFPLKIFIKDISSIIQQTVDGKHIYNFRGNTYKSLRIEGIVTEIYRKNLNMNNFQLSDCTGCINVFCQINTNEIKQSCFKKHLDSLDNSGMDKSALETLQWMYESIDSDPFDSLNSGDCVYITGKLMSERCDENQTSIFAYEYKKMSIECDLLWISDLTYIYNKHYNSANVLLKLKNDS